MVFVAGHLALLVPRVEVRVVMVVRGPDAKVINIHVVGALVRVCPRRREEHESVPDHIGGDAVHVVCSPPAEDAVVALEAAFGELAALVGLDEGSGRASAARRARGSRRAARAGRGARRQRRRGRARPRTRGRGAWRRRSCCVLPRSSRCLHQPTVHLEREREEGAD